VPPRFLLPLLAIAVCFVGATEFMLSAMLTPLADAFETAPAHAAWLVSGYALSYAIAAPVLGFLSDRIERRVLLLSSLVLFAIDGLALALAPSFEIAIGLRIFGGAAAAALIPTAFALIADLVPGNRQAGAMGVVMLGMTFGIAVGPAFAGVLTDAFGWQAPFCVTATGCLLTFATGWKVIPSRPASDPKTKATRFAWVRRSTIVRPLVAKGAWNGTAVAAFLLAGEVLRQRHGLGTGAVGGAVSAFGAGLGLGNLAVGPAGRLCKSDEAVLLPATGLVALAVTAFMLAPIPLTGGLICLALSGVGLGLAAPVSTAILAKRSGHDKGQVLAASESLNNLVILTVLPIAAALFATHGSGAATLVLGVGIVTGVGLTAIDL
jgi:multidrug resistance protein